MSPELTGILAVGASLFAAVVGFGAVMYSGLRQEIRGVRQDVATLRTETRQDIAELRTEMRQEIAGVKQEIAGVKQDVAAVKQDIGKLRERMARVEGLFEGWRQLEAAPGGPAL